MKDTKLFFPKTIKDVEDAFGDKGCIVIYKSIEETVFTLNPFGGGVSRTNEFVLRKDFEITGDKLENIVIVKVTNN